MMLIPAVLNYVHVCSESSQSMMTFSFWFASSLAMNCFLSIVIVQLEKYQVQEGLF